MKLEEIGFYTLSDVRAEHGDNASMARCEMIVTAKCNFQCPYCRGVAAYSRDCRGNISLSSALMVLQQWENEGLQNIRFSGGEPTLYPYLTTLCSVTRGAGIKRIAISTNGSRGFDVYDRLLECGVNDFSVSLDACCADDCDKMSGVGGYFGIVVDNIKQLSRETYTTVGIVLNEQNKKSVADVVIFAHSLGVHDIRIITAAQFNRGLANLEKIPNDILDAHPILKYRVTNLLSGRNVRGISEYDCHVCYLARDDSVVAGEWHFPCVIHMREGGEPVGKIGPNMRSERIAWMNAHDTHADLICKQNCLDCLVDYNNKAHACMEGLNLLAAPIIAT